MKILHSSDHAKTMSSRGWRAAPDDLCKKSVPPCPLSDSSSTVRREATWPQTCKSTRACVRRRVLGTVARPTEGVSMKIPPVLLRYQQQQGAIGYIFLWLLGVPASVLFVIFLLRGCN